jgi:hypothetical protein
MHRKEASLTQRTGSQASSAGQATRHQHRPHRPTLRQTHSGRSNHQAGKDSTSPIPSQGQTRSQQPAVDPWARATLCRAVDVRHPSQDTPTHLGLHVRRQRSGAVLDAVQRSLTTSHRVDHSLTVDHLAVLLTTYSRQRRTPLHHAVQLRRRQINVPTLGLRRAIEPSVITCRLDQPVRSTELRVRHTTCRLITKVNDHNKLPSLQQNYQAQQINNHKPPVPTRLRPNPKVPPSSRGLYAILKHHTVLLRT